LKDKAKGIYSTHLSAHPYTPGATKARVVVSVKQRLILNDRQVPENITGNILSNANIFGNLLHLTVIELSTTALIHLHILLTHLFKRTTALPIGTG